MGTLRRRVPQNTRAPSRLRLPHTVKAIATASGFTNSAVASQIYTIQSNPITSVNDSGGFTASGLALSGSAILNGTRLRLTDGGANEAGSGFVTTPMNIQSFTADFSFQLTNPNADGFTFTIHGGSAAAALGPTGGGLGYGPDTVGGTGGIPSSIAIKFDLYNNAGEGADSTGEYADGASPTTPFVDLTNSGINLHSGDIFQVHLSYSGTNLAMSITDETNEDQFSTTFSNVNIPSTIGGNTGYVGFTGGTGGSNGHPGNHWLLVRIWIRVRSADGNSRNQSGCGKLLLARFPSPSPIQRAAAASFTQPTVPLRRRTPRNMPARSRLLPPPR